MVQLPKSSKLPNPSVVAIKAKRGKQQGENIAVMKSPTVPNLSMLRPNVISVIYCFIACDISSFFYHRF
jgi:hypothetical protein